YTDRLYYNPFNNAIFANHSQGGSSGLIRSLDFGQNWQFNSTATIQAMTFHPSGVILATNNFTIFRSIDGGIQWNNTALDGVISIDNLWTSPDGLNYVIGTKNFSTYILFSSEDAGQTWVELGELPTLDFDYELAFSSNGYIFLSDNNQVFGSFNRGETWQSLPLFKEEDPISFIYKNRLSITPEQRLYVTSQELHHYMSKEPVMNGALVEGHIKVDSDADCSTEDSQAPFKNVVIEAKGTNYSYYTNTDDQGKYLFFVDTGAYEVKPKVPNQLWWSFCDTAQLTVLTELFEHDTLDFAALALVDCPLISVDLGLNTLRRCFNNEVFVQYCNQGTQPADSAWVDVMLDPFLSFMGSSQLHTELNNNTVRFFVGDVPSGDCGQFQLTVYVNCDSTVLGQTHCITAHGFPDTICFSTPNWSGAEIQASVACQDTAVLFKLQNVGDAQSQILDYIIIEDDVVMFQGSQNYTPDEFLEIPISANGHTYRIESEQEPGHPFSTLALAFQEGCGGYESLGFINHFTVNGRTPSWHTICEENTGSYDPNDKHGYPTGVGEDHRILPGQSVEYQIRFQNTGTDTALTVVIRDTLSFLLDPATLTMGVSSHNYTWQLEGAGILIITFNNINLPDSNANWEN
ncbi:MAG: DUF11 domain-containing protein, partial [Saprospiraceae bacterium]|nr:DUF11 domain-containing protein [Saprospiraceae bacterium]